MGGARSHRAARRAHEDTARDGAAPGPAHARRPGKRAEILLDRQVALLIYNNTVVRTIPVSTGKPSTPTPPGDYQVYAKIPRWWSTPFREWLPWALPFVGGIAFHEFGDVPVYPASHGCVRQSFTVARWTYNFAYVGHAGEGDREVLAEGEAVRADAGREREVQVPPVSPAPRAPCRAGRR